jgi:hypothetical protein
MAPATRLQCAVCSRFTLRDGALCGGHEQADVGRSETGILQGVDGLAGTARVVKETDSHFTTVPHGLTMRCGALEPRRKTARNHPGIHK